MLAGTNALVACVAIVGWLMLGVSSDTSAASASKLAVIPAEVTVP
jgi:hypothetical protein